MQCDELFEFERNKKGFTLTRYRRVDDPDITEIDIPSEYCSEPVTEIGDSAFEGAKYLRSVVIPEGVTVINDNAFAYCVSLEELVLPASMKTIKSAACCYCTNLRSIVFQSNNVKMYSGTFHNCPALPPETVMLSLVPDSNISSPFVYSADVAFDWETALRRDVFELALKYDSFSEGDKSMVFYMLFFKNLFVDYYSIMTKSGWIYRDENAAGFEELLSQLLDGTRRFVTNFWECAEIWITDEKMLDGIAAAAARRGETKGEPFPEMALPNKLIEHFVKIGRPDLTAWLLEYKKRRFGFGAEDKYEL